MERRTYRRSAALRLDGYAVASSHLPMWIARIPDTQRFRLNERFSWPKLYGGAKSLIKRRISPPGNIALLEASVFGCSFRDTTNRATCWAQSAPASCEIHRTQHATHPPLRLGHRREGSDLRPTQGRPAPHIAPTSRASLRIPTVFRDSGAIYEDSPPTKTEPYSDDYGPLRTGANTHQPGETDHGSHPPIESALARSAAFCEFRSALHPPQTEEIVARRRFYPATQLRAGTMGGRFRCARLFYRGAATWITPAAPM